jgi:hypothetical protein
MVSPQTPAEKLGGPAATGNGANYYKRLTDIANWPRQAAGQWVSLSDWTDSAEAIEANPELLGPEDAKSRRASA